MSISPNGVEIEKAGRPWFDVHDNPPPEDVEIETKISDHDGERNKTTLKLHRCLWWFPDMSMYVYYSPTHWRKKANP